MGVLTENGGICPASVYSTPGELNASSTGAILQDDEDPPIPDEKAVFYAQGGFAV
jgi:hypothetical protein